jgi:hypothetical protein
MIRNQVSISYFHPPSGSEATVLKFLHNNDIVSINANTLETSHPFKSDTTA